MTYTYQLPKHVSDTDIMLMFRYGKLRVRKAHSSAPEIVSDGKVLAASICIGKRNPRYRIQIRYRGRKRTIMRARAVWIAHHGLIPPTHQLHHEDGDRLNDSIDNLRLVSHAEHSAIHYGDEDF